MVHYVTIEGSLTPTDVLARGVRTTVAVTDSIRKLVEIGGAIVVVGSLDEPEAPEDEASSESSSSAETVDGPEVDSAPDASPTEDDAEPATKRGRGARRSPTTDQDTPQTQPHGES